MRRVSAALARLARHCRENGIRLIVANYPELRNPRDYPFAQVDEAIRRMAAAHDLPYIPLLPAVRDIAPQRLWVTPPDPHPSSLAHEAFARELFLFFDAELRGRPQPGKRLHGDA